MPCLPPPLPWPWPWTWRWRWQGRHQQWPWWQTLTWSVASCGWWWWWWWWCGAQRVALPALGIGWPPWRHHRRQWCSSPQLGVWAQTWWVVGWRRCRRHTHTRAHEHAHARARRPDTHGALWLWEPPAAFDACLAATRCWPGQHGCKPRGNDKPPTQPMCVNQQHNQHTHTHTRARRDRGSKARRWFALATFGRLDDRMAAISPTHTTSVHARGRILERGHRRLAPHVRVVSCGLAVCAARARGELQRGD